MHTVNVHEAKVHLSELIPRALDGEEVVIARGNDPLVRLVPLVPTDAGRRLGWAQGLVELSDDFDEPLDDFAEYLSADPP